MKNAFQPLEEIELTFGTPWPTRYAPNWGSTVTLEFIRARIMERLDPQSGVEKIVHIQAYFDAMTAVGEWVKLPEPLGPDFRVLVFGPFYDRDAHGCIKRQVTSIRVATPYCLSVHVG